MYDLESIIIILAVIILMLTGFFLTYLRLRKNGRGLTTVMFGAIYEFFNRQQREKVEQVVEHKATTTQTAQESDKEQEEHEQHDRFKNDKKGSPASESFIHRFTPRKLMRK